MTKAVRIENADSGTTYKVVVEVWEKCVDGEPPALIETRHLDHPSNMAELHITATRYIVVKEAS